MWRPRERIRYEASPGRVPDAAEAARARLFSPLRDGRLSLAQRTWVPAMVPWRATEDGFASENVLAWYERFARGQPGAIVVEATGVRDVPSGPLLRIGHDRYIEGLSRLAETVKRASGGCTRLFIQLIDFLAIRRRPEPVHAAAYPYTGPSGYECMPQYISDARGPFGRNAAATRAIRDAIRAAGLATPVVCAGGVHNFEMAEAWLKDGVCDIVAAARQSLADPDWTAKIAAGRGAQVRTCEFTNYCEALDQKHKPVTCQLWDRLDIDAPDARLSADGKRRLVAPEWRR